MDAARGGAGPSRDGLDAELRKPADRVQQKVAEGLQRGLEQLQERMDEISGRMDGLEHQVRHRRRPAAQRPEAVGAEPQPKADRYAGVVARLRERIREMEAELHRRPPRGPAGSAPEPAGERAGADLGPLMEALAEAMREDDARCGSVWVGAYHDPEAGAQEAALAGALGPAPAPAFEQERFFAGLASAPRVEMVLAVLERGPLTVAELMEAIRAQTTGQVYHHLRTLGVAGIVEPKGESRYGLTGWAGPRMAVALSLLGGQSAALPG
jgi:DNA-binding transcriptional ArsR family regulator